jgi:hypothetical protein
VQSTAFGRRARNPHSAFSSRGPNGDPELNRIIDYLEERLPPEHVVDTQTLHGNAVDCLAWDMQPSVRRMRQQGIEVDPNLRAPSSALASAG